MIPTSSSSEDSDSDYDSSCDSKEIQPCNAFGNNIKSHSRFVFKAQGEETPDSAPPSLHNADTPASNSNRPLSPWKKSCTKQRIIEDLKNDSSSIHKLVQDDWEENLDVLWQRYAHRYQRNKFKGYMKTIMNNYNAKKGPFNSKSHDPCSLVPWEESSSRKRIIKDLKDYKSSLHKQVKDLEKNLENIWKEYAPQYQRSKFKGYMDTIMLNYWAKKGPFKDTWYAKKDGSHSKGYSLLYQLMMNNDISAVSKAITVLHSSFVITLTTTFLFFVDACCSSPC